LQQLSSQPQEGAQVLQLGAAAQVLQVEQDDSQHSEERWQRPRIFEKKP